MTKQYPITVAGKTWGTVQVEQKGLYLHIFCRCEISGDVMYQLLLRQQERVEDLGVLVPQGGSYVLQKRIPAKPWAQESMTFSLKPRHERMAGQFIPIRADAPVACLAQLTRAVMAQREGQVGLSLEVEK